MSITFIKNGRRTRIDSYRNLNLLAHAQLEEMDIGSLCGGHGICGGDRIRVSCAEHAGLSPVTEIEKEHLTPEELASGWRLGCQSYPEQDDLEIEAEVKARF